MQPYISLNFVKLLVYYMECICRRERECSLYLRITRKLCVRLNMCVCVCGCILCPNIANIRAHMCVCCDAYEHTAVRDGRNEGFHIGAGASEKTEFLSRAPHIVRLIGLGVCSCVCVWSSCGQIHQDQHWLCRKLDHSAGIVYQWATIIWKYPFRCE